MSTEPTTPLPASPPLLAPNGSASIDDLRIEAAIILANATEARDRARVALNDIELIATPGRTPPYMQGKGMGAKLNEICRIAHQALAEERTSSHMRAANQTPESLPIPARPSLCAALGSVPRCTLWRIDEDGPCTAPATHRDKYGILMCPRCMETYACYTCGIVALSPNEQAHSRRPAND